MSGGAPGTSHVGESESALVTGAPMSALTEILRLERIEPLLFRGRAQATSSTRAFGGEVAGQALVAAGSDVPDDRHVHSLHAYFLRPGDPSVPIIYKVDPIRDGGSFTTRRTVATQNGEAIFHLSASFHAAEEGYAHQVARMTSPPPEALEPAEVPTFDPEDPAQARFMELQSRLPIELRFAGELPFFATMRGNNGRPRQQFWMRAIDRLPDEPLIHTCAATYASDLFLLLAALPPHEAQARRSVLQFASLDHAVWFHAPFRADEWLFYDQEGSWAGGGRALCRGQLFDRTGTLVATVMQEALIRIRARRREIA